MNRILATIIPVGFLIVAFSPAAKAQNSPPFHSFLESIEGRILISTQALEENLRTVRVAKPSWLQRNGLVNSEAEASYNQWLDTVILKEEYLSSGPGGLRMKNLEELEVNSSPQALSFAAVAFHELAHASYERMDGPLKSLFEGPLVDNLASRGVGYFARQRAPSEYYAYFQEDLFRWISTEVNDILYWNGVDAFNKLRCINSESLKKRVLRESPENRYSFILHTTNEVYTSQLIAPTSIVAGSEVQLPVNEQFFKSLHAALWSTSLAQLKIPSDRMGLVNKMNHTKQYRALLKKCRSQLGI